MVNPNRVDPGDVMVSTLSTKTARNNPLEGGPEFEAMFRNGVISTTKSHHLSRLMDIGDYDVDEALGLLGWTMDDIAEPGIFLEDDGQFERYKRKFIEGVQEDETDGLKIEVRRLQRIATEVIEGCFKLDDPDAAREHAETIQAEISEASNVERDRPRIEDEDEEAAYKLQYGNEQAIRCMERDAYYSGYRVTAAEFLKVMFGETRVLDEEDPSVLAANWINAARWVIERRWSEAVKPNIPIDEIILEEDDLRDYIQDLDKTYDRAMEVAEARWALIEPAFLTHTYKESPLATGSDRSEEALAERAARAEMATSE